MNDQPWLKTHAATSLNRLLPRLESRFADQVDDDEWEGYLNRLKNHFPRLFSGLHALYGKHYDFFYHLESILASATEMWIQRPAELMALDALRETDPHWYQSQRMIGAMCYVDLFAKDLAGLRERISYLTELGVNYLHLMPLFKVPAGDNDGGISWQNWPPSCVTTGSHCAWILCSTILPMNMTGHSEHSTAMRNINVITGCSTTGQCRMTTSAP